MTGGGLLCDQFEQGDLRRTAVPQGKDDGSEAAVDVELRLPELGVSADQPAGRALQPASGPFVFATEQESPVDLPSVGVAGEDQVESCPRRFADHPWIV